nr:DUF721 domain-containing protein [Deinobacterium chartae]
MRELARLLDQTLSRNRLSGGVRRARAVLLWPEVVGSELARLTRARSQQGGVLFVEAADSVLANFLTMQRHVFLQRLQEKLGDSSVRELRFAVGRMNSQETPRTTVVEALPEPDRRNLERMVTGLPGELQDAARRAADAVARARIWRERQGWKPCPICATPTDKSGPCHVCRDLLANPQVQGASLKLARNPDLALEPERFTFLSVDGFEAARYLAREYLEGKMDELIHEVVSSGGDPVYRQFLLHQAQCYLALGLRSSLRYVSPDHWKELPERVYRVLTAHQASGA